MFRLEQKDSYQQQLSSTVQRSCTYQEKPAILLAESIFYPTSGGQLHDTGRIWPRGEPEAAVDVVDVIAEEGQVFHVLSAPLPETVSQIEASIDWTRRIDHMQQHTGQHIVSAALQQLLGAETRSSRLGREIDTIDIPGDFSMPALREVEELACQIAQENREVRVLYPGAAELSRLSLRREPKVEDHVRVVEVAGFDLSPCGGTHVRQTGEIGVISLTHAERYKGGTRISFLCGKRVLRAFQAFRTESDALTKLLSAAGGLQTAAVEKLHEELQHRSAQIQNLTKLWAEEKAKALITAQGPLVRFLLPEPDKAMLRLLGQKIAATPGAAAFLALVEGEKAHLMFAASPSAGIDMNRALQAVFARFGGKGGGRPNVAEGSCPAAHAQEALDLFQKTA